MTFSIVARGEDGCSFGVAVASKFLAVGSVVPAARAGIGAVATQATANLTYREAGLELLQSGVNADQVVGTLTSGDLGKVSRQLGVVAPTGAGATYTGSGCSPWAGGRSGEGYALQGNILESEAVVASMESAWLNREPETPLSRSLLGALDAGDRAGGDRRGRQSAALLVVSPGAGYGGRSDVQVDLRVDDHPHPLEELERLLELHNLYFGKTPREQLLPFSDELAGEVRRLLAERGHPPAGGSAAQLQAALRDWAGVENLEERLVEGAALDPVVLKALRASH
ncbi:MAG TPA: DUF1028 domain-containing protein [Acidimicrobiales bacterium]|nr:DUF1028 domain-containing protein [Acidimicrobiales bacterium]